jgi:hypothetical protein
MVMVNALALDFALTPSAVPWVAHWPMRVLLVNRTVPPSEGLA